MRSEALRSLARIDRATEDIETACARFFETLKPSPQHIVSVYWPQASEFDVHPVIERLLAEQIPCALPIIQKDTLILGFVRWSEDIALKKNLKGVYEPVMNRDEPLIEPDIMITPLLAFDRRGVRLGRGGGYYDATLAAYRHKKSVTAVGMAYAQQACLFNLPCEAHDQRLDWVITPEKAHYFGT